MKKKTKLKSLVWLLRAHYAVSVALCLGIITHMWITSSYIIISSIVLFIIALLGGLGCKIKYTIISKYLRTKKYVARDKNGNIFVYNEMPIYLFGYWLGNAVHKISKITPQFEIALMQCEECIEIDEEQDIEIELNVEIK